MTFQYVLIIYHLDPNTLYSPAQAVATRWNVREHREKYNRAKAALGAFARRHALELCLDNLDTQGRLHDRWARWYGRTWKECLADKDLYKAWEYQRFLTVLSQIQQQKPPIKMNEGRPIPTHRPAPAEETIATRMIGICRRQAIAVAALLCIAGFSLWNSWASQPQSIDSYLSAWDTGNAFSQTQVRPRKSKALFLENRPPLFEGTILPEQFAAVGKHPSLPYGRFYELSDFP